MDRIPERHGTWTRADALALAALLCAIALVGLYLMTDVRASFHSDSALKSVLAAVALDEHRLVPHGWTFANGDILTATPYTLLVPLQSIFGMSFTTNAVATMLCFLAMLGAMYFLARTISAGPKAQAFAACALAASTLSAANLEFIAAQGAYSLYAALALPLFALLLRSPDGVAKWLPAVFAFVLAASNPTRAWVAVFAPSILALIATTLTAPRGSHAGGLGGLRDRVVGMISPALIALMVGAIAGHLLYTLAIVPSMQNLDAAARVSPASAERALFVARHLPSDWFGYFEVSGAWATLSIAGRILQLGVWLIACAVLIAPAVALLSARCSPRVKYAAWLIYALLASGLVPLVLLDGLYWGRMEIRYATLGILVGYALIPAVAYQLFAERRRRLFVWTTGVLLALSVATSFSWQSIAVPANPDARGVSLQQRMELIDVLRKQHVGTAVATYWNSHVLSVLSSGATIVSPVSYNDRLGPFPHHVPDAPLHGTAGAMEAVILNDAELSQDGGAAIIAQLGKPRSKLRTNGFNLWIYDSGVVDQIFGVGYRFDTPVQASKVSIESSAAVPACTANACVLRLHVKNIGQLALATAGKAPMRIGLRGLGGDDTVVAELGRIDFQLPLRPGESDDLATRIGKMPDGVVGVQACLIQEQVQWLCERTSLARDASVVTLDQPVDPALVGVVLSAASFPACPTPQSAPCRANLTIRNVGKVALNGPGSMPLVMGYRAHRSPSVGGGTTEGRIALPHPLGAGTEVTVPVVLNADEAGLNFQVCVLQEHVAWFCDRTDTEAAVSTPADGT